MNRIFLATTAVICLAAAGCSSTPAGHSIQQSEEVKNNRKKIENFINTYIQPEYEIPTVYAPEWKQNPDYKEIAELTKNTYNALPVFKQAAKIKSLSLTYATGDVKKSFIISVANAKNKISLLCRDEDNVAELFKAVAEMPEVLTMPKGMPASMEDAVIRELYMIHSFILNPHKLAKSISMDVVPMMDFQKKTSVFEKKEFRIDGRLCYRIGIQLRDMFGGGTLRLYVDGQNIVRIEIPSLALDMKGDSAFILGIDDFQSVNGIVVPSSFVFRGERFLLKEHKIGR